MIKNFKYSEIAYYLFLLVLSAIFVSIFCEVASPFTYRYVGDSSIFMTMGRMFADGMIPYLEFFDHKGPSLVLLEGLGQAVAPYRRGVWILEFINLSLCLIILYRIGNLIFDKKKSSILILAFLILFSRIASKGNTSEELSLVPLFLSIYILCKYYFQEKKISAKDGFIIGLCFSFLFWLRLNNAGAVVAVCVFFFVATLIDREYKSLRNLILYFILGQLPFTILYLGYFFYHDAVYEVIYATFLFNFKYVSSLFSTDGEAFEVNIIVALVLLVGTALEYIKEKDWKIILLSTLLYFFSYITVNIGYAYAHYYILMCPAFVFGVVLILKSIESGRIINIAFLLLLAAFSALTIRSGYYVISEGEYFKAFATKRHTEIHEVIAEIPKNERSRTYYYGIDSNFYLLAEVNPNYKYFVLQEWHGRHDSEIFDEINQMLISDNYPIWIMGEFFRGKENFDWSLNKEFAQFLKDNYDLHLHKHGFLLFKRKE